MKPFTSHPISARHRRIAIGFLAFAVIATGCGTSTNQVAAPSPTQAVETTMGHDMAGMDMGDDHAPMLSTDATKSTENGYTLTIDKPTLPAGKAQPLSFVITTDRFGALKDYEIEQTKKLHLILVRSDLSGYQHLHPELGEDGHWSIPVDLENAGRWRVITDFTPISGGKVGDRIALGADLAVEGTGTDQPTPQPSMNAKADEYSVDLVAKDVKAGGSTSLNFTITEDGKPVTEIVPYLGAFGHLVAIRSTDLGYLHVHPTVEAADVTATAGPTVAFVAEIPTAGLHGLYLQFATASGVHTAVFTINVLS
jgi:hypothetical protein